MEKKKEVLIIIPAYNEEKTITALLEQLEKPEISELADVLVMNDAPWIQRTGSQRGEIMQW